MPYEIKLTASPSDTYITINDNERNDDTSLTLLGKNFPNYGEIIANDFVHLLENFANTAEPSGTPLPGQLWFNTATRLLLLWDGDAWVSAGLPPDTTYSALTLTFSAVDFFNDDAPVHDKRYRIRVTNDGSWVLEAIDEVTGDVKHGNVPVITVTPDDGYLVGCVSPPNDDSSLMLATTEFVKRQGSGILELATEAALPAVADAPNSVYYIENWTVNQSPALASRDVANSVWRFYTPQDYATHTIRAASHTYSTSDPSGTLFRTDAVNFTATIAGFVMTVTAVASGVLSAGQYIYSGATGTSIVGQITGSTGGTGTYTIATSQTVSSSTAMIATCDGMVDTLPDTALPAGWRRQIQNSDPFSILTIQWGTGQWVIGPMSSVTVISDGTTFSVANYPTRAKLGCNLNMWVRDSTGSDSGTLGLTSTSPLKTIQAAINIANEVFDSNGQTIFINIYDGTYTAGGTVWGPLLGNGTIWIRSVSGNPAACKVALPSGGACFSCGGAGRLIVEGFSLESNSGGLGDWGVPGLAFNVITGGILRFRNIWFGPCQYIQIYAGSGGYISIIAENDQYQIYGGGHSHIGAGASGGVVAINEAIVTIRNPVTYITAFVNASSSGLVYAPGVTWINKIYVTGTRYYIDTAAYVVTGLAAADYLPGTAAGYNYIQATTVGGVVHYAYTGYYL